MYSLKKSTHILFQAVSRYKTRKKYLSAAAKDELRGVMTHLQNALLAKDQSAAALSAQNLERLYQIHLKKSPGAAFVSSLFSLAVALLIAVIIRGAWFELYVIPSGSMRPTLREQDMLTVSKTRFGINIPLQLGHFTFYPDLVKRNSIFIFTGENMPIPDVDTYNFYLFPAKKQYVKRLIAKPGDTLYFYGGLIYGMDQAGKDISPELQINRLADIDHIPFLRFEGKVTTPPASTRQIASPATLHLMNIPIAKLSATSNHSAEGEMLVPGVTHYSDLWGIGNYALARILSQKEMQQRYPQEAPQISSAPYYLELEHSPSLQDLTIRRDDHGRMRPAFAFEHSLLPLSQEHIETLFHNLYTARFVVKEGFARRWGSGNWNSAFAVSLPGVPNGEYEFFAGKGYQVRWRGVTSELPASHPLMHFDMQTAVLFFNTGIEMSSYFLPQNDPIVFPARYAYFRNGDLYLMGAPILTKADPALESFVERELQREQNATSLRPYIPFVDHGAPLAADGSLDRAFLKKFGLTIPANSYLGLGDNHAMSSDCREFGFVPQENLRGGPSLLFWPPGHRWGAPNQPSLPLFTPPRLTIWILAAIIGSIWTYIHISRRRLPYDF